ncbi:MAG: hypothetical protein ABSH06_05080 [Thermodesulfobacteriota bacterium]
MDSQLTNLIDLTLREISKGYVPGTLKWIKKTRPNDWTKVLVEEGMINKTALEGDVVSLKETLSTYQKLIFSLYKKFKKETGDV